MTKVVVFNDGSGGMSVLIPAKNIYVPKNKSPLERGDFKSAQEAGSRLATIEEIAARDVPPLTEWHVVDRSSLPQDRYFRNAWFHVTGAVSIDIDKAREIHKNVLREQRAPLLAALDLDYMRADEAGDTKAKAVIVAKKQVLRDLTKHPEIAAAKTPEELKLAALGK